MLERATGCLESGSLRRLLPASRSSVKSRRTLHSGFWSHGASDDISTLWTVLVRGPESLEQQHREKHRIGPAAASSNSGLLDFLYPTEALNLIRRYSSWGVERQESNWTRSWLGKGGHRHYTSSAKDNGTESPGPALEMPLPNSMQPSIYQDVRILYEKFGLERDNDFAEAWRQYVILEDGEQMQYRRVLIDYFGKSDRVVDAERITELFGMLNDDHKGESTYRYTVKAFLKLRNLSDATNTYSSASKNIGIPAGSESLLVHSFLTLDWERAASLWKEVHDFCGAKYNIFADFDNLPDRGFHVLQLHQSVQKLLEPRINWTLDSENSYNRKRHSWKSESQQRDSMRRALKDNATLLRFTVGVIRRTMYNSEIINAAKFVMLLASLRQWKFASSSDYQRALNHLLWVGEHKLVSNLYLMVRQEKGFYADEDLLHSLLRSFISAEDFLGVESVIDDFFSLHNGPTQLAYRLCLKEFSRRGDAKTVIVLFEQFSARYRNKNPHSNVELSTNIDGFTANDFAPLLHVYARRGEVREVRRVFDDIEGIYGLEPTTMCWNILLNAYNRVQNYHEAYDCFQRLLNLPNTKPDKFTLGTMMTMSTKHGDLDDLYEIAELADSLGIVMDTNYVLECSVLANLKNGNVKEAEEICEEATQMSMYNGTTTQMWNAVLYFHAINRTIDHVNRTMARMHSLNVRFDRETYGCLMQCLAMVGLPSRAWRIVFKVMPGAGIKPTRAHYGLLMGAYINTREYTMVPLVQKKMKADGFAPAASANLMAIKNSGIHNSKGRSAGNAKKQLQVALKTFASTMSGMDAQDVVDMPRKGGGRLPLDIAYPTMYYQFMIYILGATQNFDSAEQLYHAYKDLLPHNKEEPISICSAMMSVAARQRNWGRVEKFWTVAFSVALKTGQSMGYRLAKAKIIDGRLDFDSVAKVGVDAADSGETQRVLPHWQFSLVVPLQVYMNALITQGKSRELVRTVARVQEAGFALDTQNWNTYISELAARWKYPKDAFMLCELWLMPGWQGWRKLQRRKTPWIRQLENMRDNGFFVFRKRLLGAQRDMRRKDVLRPRTTTMIRLDAALREVEYNSITDPEAEAILKEIRSLCPQTIAALERIPNTTEEGIQALQDKKDWKHSFFKGGGRRKLP